MGRDFFFWEVNEENVLLLFFLGDPRCFVFMVVDLYRLSYLHEASTSEAQGTGHGQAPGEWGIQQDECRSQRKDESTTTGCRAPWPRTAKSHIQP